MEEIIYKSKEVKYLVTDDLGAQEALFLSSNFSFIRCSHTFPYILFKYTNSTLDRFYNIAIFITFVGG